MDLHLHCMCKARKFLNLTLGMPHWELGCWRRSLKLWEPGATWETDGFPVRN